jgi:hypothetical protein
VSLLARLSSKYSCTRSADSLLWRLLYERANSSRGEDAKPRASQYRRQPGRRKETKITSIQYCYPSKVGVTPRYSGMALGLWNVAHIAETLHNCPAARHA